MKKYTKRLKDDVKAFRFIKNLAAIGAVVHGAWHSLIWNCCPPFVVLTYTAYAIGIAIIGEVLFNIGMTAVETAESIQEKHETI